MSDQEKVFEYKTDGLTYIVTVYEENGEFFADINVTEGAMDVNAIYFGDSDFSGQSESLNGPLNMNGGGSQYEGETVQWDDAVKLSDPGLGPDGTDKETYVSEGDTLTVPLSIGSLDEIDFFGIRATSTSTDEGSIKAVSGDPEIHEEPEEPEEPQEPTFDKVFFAYGVDSSGGPDSGYAILSEEPEDNEFNNPFLPEDTEPTFENYLTYFEEIGGDVAQIDTIVFYSNDEEGDLQEEFRIDAPEDGFADSDAVLDAYDAALEEEAGDEGTPDGEMEALELMAAISLETHDEEEPSPQEEEDPDELMLI